MRWVCHVLTAVQNNLVYRHGCALYLGLENCDGSSDLTERHACYFKNEILESVT